MFNQTTYAVLSLICLIVALVAVIGIGRYLRKIAMKSEHYTQKDDWYRFVAPAFIATILAYWGANNIERGVFWQWMYYLLIAIGLPFAGACHLNLEQFAGKPDRFLILVYLLFLLNAAFFTFSWTLHFRANHASDIEYNEQEDHPHADARAYFLLPLWFTTAGMGVVAAVVPSMMKRQRQAQRTTQGESDVGSDFVRV